MVVVGTHAGGAGETLPAAWRIIFLVWGQGIDLFHHHQFINRVPGNHHSWSGTTPLVIHWGLFL